MSFFRIQSERPSTNLPRAPFGTARIAAAPGIDSPDKGILLRRIAQI